MLGYLLPFYFNFTNIIEDLTSPQTDATLVEEYSERCRAEHERALQLHDKSERFSLKVRGY